LVKDPAGKPVPSAEVLVYRLTKTAPAEYTRIDLDSATTDSAGKFRIDSLAPGTYQVGVFHPLLDTLGISLSSRPFHVGADSTSFVILAVPSATTIIHMACPIVGPRDKGTSAVIGHVIDPESLQPVSGVDVSIAWTQLVVSKEVGVRRTPRVIRDSTDAQGGFKLCGLPSGMQATLQARRAGSVTAEIPIELGEGVIRRIQEFDPVGVADEIFFDGDDAASLLMQKGEIFGRDIIFYFAAIAVYIVIGLIAVYTMFLLALSKIALSVLIATNNTRAYKSFQKVLPNSLSKVLPRSYQKFEDS